MDTEDHPELWEWLKKWIRITNPLEFDTAWEEIKLLAPPEFINYLEEFWTQDRFKMMWSAIYRTARTIHQNCDTNMLIEAWHHVLKGKFLQGKRNRRLDHLILCLIAKVLPYYCLKQQRQDHGFEGFNLEIAKRQAILKRYNEQFTLDDIEVNIYCSYMRIT